MGYINRIGEQLGVEFGEWIEEYPRNLWDPSFEEVDEGDVEADGDSAEVVVIDEGGDENPEDIAMEIMEIDWDPERCLLEQLNLCEVAEGYLAEPEADFGCDKEVIEAACSAWEDIVKLAFDGDDPAMEYVMRVSSERDALFEKYDVERMTSLVMDTVDKVNTYVGKWSEEMEYWDQYGSASTVTFTAATAMVSAILVSM